MKKYEQLELDLALQAETLLMQWLPGLVKTGNNQYKCATPQGGAGDSCSIKKINDKWIMKEFNGKEKAAVGLINIYARSRGLTWKEAAVELENMLRGDLVSQASNHTDSGMATLLTALNKQDAEKTYSSGDETEPPKCPGAPPKGAVFSGRLGVHSPVMTAWYRTPKTGEKYFCVARYEYNDTAGKRKKLPIPWFWDTKHVFEYEVDEDGGYVYEKDGDGKRYRKGKWVKGSGWRKGTYADVDRLPYNANMIYSYPDGLVMVVEGEKCAKAALERLGVSPIATTWMGGASAWSKTDWSLLKGRAVLLWPDADEAGVKAMEGLARHLLDQIGVKRLSILDVSGQSEKWDIADAIQLDEWSTQQIKDFIKKNRQRVRDSKAVGKVIRQITKASVCDVHDVVNLKSFPHVKEKGTLLDTMENLEALLNHYDIQPRYNVIRKNVDMSIPGQSFSSDNRANSELATVRSLCARNEMPTASLMPYIKTISDRDRYNPVAEFIDSKPWDGVSRLQNLYDTLETPKDFDRNMMRLLVRKWLLSAVAAALQDENLPEAEKFWTKGVLILQGEQSKGKTRWVRSLLPNDKQDLIKDGATLDPSNKDSVSGVIKYWIVELGELDATFKKSDIEKLKGFITQRVDSFRRPYDTIESDYARRTVFFGSVNPERFLVDETGNLRWWTIPIVNVDADHGIDMQQLWAEVAVLYRNGEKWWLIPEEDAKLNAINKHHEQLDPIEELIQRKFDWTADDRNQKLSATEVMQFIGYMTPTKSQVTNCGRILTKLGATQKRTTGGKRLYDLPPDSAGGFDDDYLSKPTHALVPNLALVKK